jgi:hypothetical protein
MTKERGKPGPKGWELTPELLKQIETDSANGLTQVDIAWNVGLSASEWYKKKQQYPEIEDAIKRSKARAHRQAAGLLHQTWSDPTHPKQLTALMFYLKTQHGWKDSAPTEQPTPLPVSIDFKKVTEIDKEEQ